MPITLERLPASGEVRHAFIPEAAVTLIRNGSGTRRYAIEKKAGEIGSAPGMLDFCARGLCFERASWEGVEGEVIGIQLPGHAVNSLFHSDRQALQIQTRFEQFNPALAQLMEALWSEAATGSPNGALYVQGLTMALVALLRKRYALPAAQAHATRGKFGPRDAERLRSFIVEHLRTDLSVEHLAAVVNMSPWHFGKLFKATFSQTPHGFVLSQRIEAASRTLRAEAGRPVADIANEFNFSSQAHFTEVFRRKMGTTPGRWRRDA